MAFPDMSSNTPAPSEVPAGFVVVEELGRGGMGRVLRVRRGGVDYALKQMLDSRDIELRARFEREARVMAQVSSCPFIVTVHTYYDEPLPSILMELVEGRSLTEHFRDGPLPLSFVRRFAVELAEALAAIHEQGRVHRDVKPDNTVISGEDGSLRLMDFGLVGGDLSERLTATGCVLGTPRWMAPEQLVGEPVGPTADVWAFGAIVYRALAGRPAFDGKSVASMRAAILRDSPSPLRELRPDAPEDLVRIAEGCLSKQPEDRPADGRALVDALDGHAPLPARPRSRWLPAFAIGLPLLLCALILGLLLMPKSPDAGLRVRLVELERRLRKRLATPHRREVERLEELLPAVLEPGFLTVGAAQGAETGPGEATILEAEDLKLFHQLESSEPATVGSEFRGRLLEARARLEAREARRRELDALERTIREGGNRRSQAETLSLLEQLVTLRRELASESSSRPGSGSGHSYLDDEADVQAFVRAVEVAKALALGESPAPGAFERGPAGAPVKADEFRLLARFHEIYQAAKSGAEALQKPVFRPLPEGLSDRLKSEAGRLWLQSILRRVDSGTVSAGSTRPGASRSDARAVAVLMDTKFAGTVFGVNLEALAEAAVDREQAVRVLQGLAEGWTTEARDAWRNSGGDQPMLAGLPAFHRAFDASKRAHQLSPAVRLTESFPTVVLEAFALNMKGELSALDHESATLQLMVEAARLGRFVSPLAKDVALKEVNRRFPEPVAGVDGRFWHGFVASRKKRRSSKADHYQEQLRLLTPLLEKLEGTLLWEAMTWQANAYEELWDLGVDRPALRPQLQDCYERLLKSPLDRSSRPDEICWYRYKLAHCLRLDKAVQLGHLTQGLAASEVRIAHADQSRSVDSYNPWLSSVSANSARRQRLKESLARLQDSGADGG